MGFYHFPHLWDPFQVHHSTLLASGDKGCLSGQRSPPSRAVNPSVPGIKDCWDTTSRSLWRSKAHSDFQRPLCWQHTATSPSLFLVHLLPGTISLLCRIPTGQKAMLLSSLTHRARVRLAAADTQSKSMPDGDPPETSLIFGGLYQACWKPADIPRVCHDTSLLQIHLEDSEQCFTAVLWRGRLRLNTLQKCKPLTPQSRQALMLYTIFSYSPWLAFLVFCNVVWLVWIWIIIFFYSFKLRLLGPSNKYVWIVGM